MMVYYVIAFHSEDILVDLQYIIWCEVYSMIYCTSSAKNATGYERAYYSFTSDS